MIITSHGAVPYHDHTSGPPRMSRDGSPAANRLRTVHRIHPRNRTQNAVAAFNAIQDGFSFSSGRGKEWCANPRSRGAYWQIADWVVTSVSRPASMSISEDGP